MTQAVHLHTVHEVNKRLLLRRYGDGKHLWTRELAREIRTDLTRLVSAVDAGDAVIIDAGGIEVFDYSFANELFGKTVLMLPREYPGRFVIVENLTPYARENLERALEGLGLAIIERQGSRIGLLGKVHRVDTSTFEALVRAGRPIVAAELKDRLGLTITAMNERLTKLTQLGLLFRQRSASSAGREQYVYQVPA